MLNYSVAELRIINKLSNKIYATHKYKNDIFIWLFCQVFGNRTKHKLQQKNCGSYFLNITNKKIICE